MRIARKVAGIVVGSRLVLAGSICIAFSWQTGFPPLVLFLPYLLYEGTAVAWPRLSGVDRYVPVVASIVALSLLTYVFRGSALVGIGLLIVLAPALDYLPLEDGIKTALSRDIKSVIGRESRFDSPGAQQRTQQFPLEVDHREKLTEDGFCPDCGTNLDQLLVGSHCPNCGNPEVIEDER